MMLPIKKIEDDLKERANKNEAILIEGCFLLVCCFCKSPTAGFYT